MNTNCTYHILIVSVLALLLFLVSFSSPLRAQTGIPPGSYKNSCRNIQVMTGNVLWAVCDKRDGTSQKSTLRYLQCEGDISNNNGVLTCKKKPGKKPPSGSYQSTCKNIRVDGKQLKAKCQKRNGSWNNTSINYKNCNKDIKNDNGKLTCGSSNNSNFPKGSYKKSCKNLYMEGKVLEADCKNEKGKWKHSSIKYKNCNKGIWNDNGKLRCNK